MAYTPSSSAESSNNSNDYYTYTQGLADGRRDRLAGLSNQSGNQDIIVGEYWQGYLESYTETDIKYINEFIITTTINENNVLGTDYDPNAIDGASGISSSDSVDTPLAPDTPPGL